MSLIRSAAFLRAYRFAPHRLINGAARRLAQARRPRWAVASAISAWIRRDRIDMTDFEDGPFGSIEEFFLRRLRPGRRPLGPGLLSPVDGRLLAVGPLAAETTLPIKGRHLSLDRLVNGRAGRTAPRLPLDDYAGGQMAVIFLSPRGYHRVHMPTDATIVESRWLPGRYFPQNEQALAHIDGVHERNERLVLRCRPTGQTTGQRQRELLLVLVGASVIGGINLADVPRSTWMRSCPTDLNLPRDRGQELGHFTFGSTVVLALPRGSAPIVRDVGDDLKMGETLLETR